MKFRTEAERIKYEEDYLPAYNALMTCYPFTLDDHADEQWQPINDDYHVSNYGRIKSFKQRRTGKILKPSLNMDGYLFLHISIGGERKYFSVHVLVAKAFIPNPDNKPEVNHRIGWKLNCYVGNLEWSTHEENMEHAVNNGLLKIKGTENSQAKLKDEETILYIRNNPDGLTQQQLAEKFGMTHQQISDIQTGKYWKHVGGTVRSKIDTRIPDEKRAAIRADRATGQYTKAALARKYGVSQPTISNIINEK